MVANTPPPSLLPQLLNAINARQTVALVTVVAAAEEFAPQLGRRRLVYLNGESPADPGWGAAEAEAQAQIRRVLERGRSQLLTLAGGKLTLFVEVQQRPPTLLVVGAGHVAQPLAQLGTLIDFEVVVLDDRPQYANRRRFPTADRVIAAPFAPTLRDWPIDPNTFVVLVTRGHTHDVACLLEIINSPARYIGMIGSKRRISAVFKLLTEEQGIPSQALNRVYAPIGLDIGAETPAEIAVCIIAEIINHYRGGRAESLAEALRRDRRQPLHPGRHPKKGTPAQP